MSQSDSPPVLDPTRIAILPAICAYLTTLRHQPLAGTGGLRPPVEEVSWDVQGKDVFLVPAIFAAMHTALDAYTALVAERLAVLAKVAAKPRSAKPGVGQGHSTTTRPPSRAMTDTCSGMHVSKNAP